MMIVFVALAASLQAAPALAADKSAEVVVMGQKLKNWRASVRDRDGKVTCKTRVSSGDKDIDAVGCNAMMTCVAQMRSRLPGTIDKTIPATQREANQKALNRDLTSCVMANHDAGLAALADRRYAERQVARP